MNKNISYIKNGKFEEKGDQLIYHGEEKSLVDKYNNNTEIVPSYGYLLFPGKFKEGKVSYDVKFTGVSKTCRCGFLLDYTNNNGSESYYSTGLRNDSGTYSLEKFDSKWDFKILKGEEQSLCKDVKYTLTAIIKGSVLTLFINDVKVYTYSNFEGKYGGFGIFIYNAYDTIIDNIDIKLNEPTVFNIMKFEKDFDDLYYDVIVPECNKNGYKAVRADECYTTATILDDIIREISNASIIIADVTMDNPNVFYELGYAHALKKPTILLADISKRGSLPFDISGYRTVFYTNSIGGKKDVENKLSKFIENITKDMSSL